MMPTQNGEPRVWFEFSGDELAAFFGRRALWYEGRMKSLTDLEAKMPKVDNPDDVPEEAKQFYSNKTVVQAQNDIKSNIRAAEKSARRFRLLEAHIKRSVVFKLTEDDITQFELVAAME